MRPGYGGRGSAAQPDQHNAARGFRGSRRLGRFGQLWAVVLAGALATWAAAPATAAPAKPSPGERSAAVSAAAVRDAAGDTFHGRAPGPPAAAPVAGAFVAAVPTRLADTRYGTGTARARIPAGRTLVLQVAGRAGVPSTGAAAVAVDVNVVDAVAAGRLTVFADGTARPDIASVNFTTGPGSLALVVSALSTAGRMAIWNSSTGPIDVIVDVSGYFVGGASPAAGGFVPLPPARSLDTRTGVGAARGNWQDVVAGLYSTLSWQVSGRNGVPTGATAAVVAVTATAVVNTGQLIPFDDEPSFTPGVDPALVLSDSTYVPVTGTAFTSGRSVTNVYLVPLSAAGRARLDLGSQGAAASPGTDVIGDVVGYIRAGGAQLPGTYQPLPVGQLSTTVLAAHATVEVKLPVAGGAAVSLALTAADPGSSGGLVVFGQGTARPATRNVNFAAGQRVSNTAIVPTSAASTVSLANTSGAPVTVTIDLLGYFRGAAVPAAGTVWASGSNFAGGMGLGFASDGTTVPAPVALAGVRKVASSAGSSYAVTADGTLWSWGRNNDPEVVFEGGQLGLGNTTDQWLPVRVPGLTDVVDVDASYPNGYALLRDGTVWQWGGEGVGEVDAPAKVNNLTGVVALDHSYAVKADGTVWVVSYAGTFDTGCPASGCFVAAQVPGLTGIAQVSGALALRSDGVLECWGVGPTPVVISNITGVRTLAGNAVLLADGSVWIAPTDGTRFASQVPGLTGVSTLGALAVKADGSVWTFSAAGAVRLANLPPAAQVAPAPNLVVAR